jgi:hypothetical protein
VSQLLTSELYGAAFGSAAVAYGGAYLDAVIGYIMLNTRYRAYDGAVRDRAAAVSSSNGIPSAV